MKLEAREPLFSSEESNGGWEPLAHDGVSDGTLNWASGSDVGEPREDGLPELRPLDLASGSGGVGEGTLNVRPGDLLGGDEDVRSEFDAAGGSCCAYGLLLGSARPLYAAMAALGEVRFCGEGFWDARSVVSGSAMPLEAAVTRLREALEVLALS